MRRHALKWLLGSMMTLLALPHLGQAEDVKETILVIAHQDVALRVLTRDELRPIFQTKKNSWPDGSAARPFNLPEADSTRRGFDAAVLGLDPDRVARYWIDRKIRGGDHPPQIVPSAAVMMAIIGKTPGAIGYVDSNVPLSPKVKVIAKIVGGLIVAP